jgi:hypothetical protein
MIEESPSYVYNRETFAPTQHIQSMLLRDHFAGLAMQEILASQYEDGIYVGDADNDSEHLCARGAYIMADAMLKARKA